MCVAGRLIGGVESRNTRVLPGFYRVCSWIKTEPSVLRELLGSCPGRECQVAVRLRTYDSSSRTCIFNLRCGASGRPRADRRAPSSSSAVVVPFEGHRHRFGPPPRKPEAATPRIFGSRRLDRTNRGQIQPRQERDWYLGNRQYRPRIWLALCRWWIERCGYSPLTSRARSRLKVMGTITAHLFAIDLIASSARRTAIWRSRFWSNECCGAEVWWPTGRI